MRKGEVTRLAILDGALQVVSRIGFRSLSIGSLAKHMKMSKSGLFAHFQSKEQLQLQTLEHARRQFVEVVVRPALSRPDGEERLEAFFDNWRRWDSKLEGGCLFVGAAHELDDQPGPLRDALVKDQREWQGLLADTAASAVREGEFRHDVEPAQFAYEFQGLILVHHYASHLLLGDEAAGERTRAALERLMASARTTVTDR